MILWIFVAASLLQLIIPPLLPPQGSPTNSTTPAGTNTSTPASSTNLSVAPLNVWKVIVSVISIVVGAIGLYGVYKDLHAYLLPFFGLGGHIRITGSNNDHHCEFHRGCNFGRIARLVDIFLLLVGGIQSLPSLERISSSNPSLIFHTEGSHIFMFSVLYIFETLKRFTIM